MNSIATLSSLFYLAFYANRVSFIHAYTVPYISNVTLVSSSLINTTFRHNQTLHGCLCAASNSSLAFNSFPNGTCQFFSQFPISYTLRNETNGRLYFPQGIFPNESKTDCCMSNLTLLLEKLRNGQRQSANVSQTRNLIIDDDGYLFAVETASRKILRFHANNLSLVNETLFGGTALYGFNLKNRHLYLLALNGPITILNVDTLNTLGNVSSIDLRSTRSIILLNENATMLVSAFRSKKILVFKRNTTTNYDYHLDYFIPVNYSIVHGLTYVDDNHFYATDYATNTVYSYKRQPHTSSWNETLLIDARNLYSGPGGANVIMDPCGRLWFVFETSFIFIYDQTGVYLDSFNVSNAVVINMLFTTQYVLYYSDRTTGNNNIVRIDPKITC